MKALLRFVVLGLTVTLLAGCEEEEGGGPGPPTGFNPVLKQGNTYHYRNWNLDQNNNVDSTTEWKSTTRVAAQGQSIGRFSDVFILIDSSFTLQGAFIEAETLYVRLDEKKDLYFLGFVYQQVIGSPLEQFITLAPDWNRIFAFSVGVGNSWTIVSIDTTVDVGGTPVPVRFNITGTLEPQETVNVPAGSISAYKVKIHVDTQLGTVPIAFDTFFWFSDNPSGLIKQFDPSVTTLTFTPGTQSELSSYTIAP